LHAVDTVLNLAVLAPDMERTEGVLGDAWGLQQNFVHLGIGALRHFVDILLAETIPAAAGLHTETIAGCCQPFGREGEVKGGFGLERDNQRRRATARYRDCGSRGLESTVVGYHQVVSRRDMFEREMA
jgi:hypothetical protein